MSHRFILAALVIACVADAKPRESSPPQPTESRDSVVLVPTPDTLRGLYVNRWAAIGPAMWRLIDLAKNTEVNVLVIDVEDDRGLMLYRSSVPLARAIGADTTQPMSRRRLRAVLETLRLNRFYPFAHIVLAEDPVLADRRRDWAIRRRD